MTYIVDSIKLDYKFCLSCVRHAMRRISKIEQIVIMYRFKVTWILFCGLMTYGCAFIKINSPTKLNTLDKTDYTKLNGEFSNYPASSNGVINFDRQLGKGEFRPLTFWSQLNGTQVFIYNEAPKSETVKLIFFSDKRGKAELWDSEKLEKVIKIKGKIKNGYFYRRPYLIASPFFPVIFGYDTYRYRIGISGNAIVVDYKWNAFAFAVAAGKRVKGNSRSVFDKR